MVSSRLATWVETETILGIQDIYDLIEILAVDAHNRRIAQKASEAP